MYRALDRIASRQNALITTRQLRDDVGLSGRQIGRFCKKGAFERIRRGVYRVAGAPLTWIQAVHAATLAAGPDAVASHTTAAAIWGFRHVDRTRSGLHLTAGHYIRMPGITAHTSTIGPSDTTICQGVPVTTPERTLLDLAATLPANLLGECLDDAIRRGIIHLNRLRDMMAAAVARGGRRRRRPVNQLLEERLPGYHPGGSDWEKGMDALWDALGLEPGARQFRTQVNGSSYIIDRAIPALKIGVEFNGYEHHHLRSDNDQDARRAADLSAAGWHMITITAGVRPESICRAVQRVVDDRRRWLAGSDPPPSQGAEAA